jgi:hypothetical protein
MFLKIFEYSEIFYFLSKIIGETQIHTRAHKHTQT